MEIRDLRGLTLAVCIMVGINMLVSPVVLFAPEIFPDLYPVFHSDMPTGPSAAFLFTVIGITLLTWILFGRWIYLAGSNLVEAGYQDLEFTPAARIWWFAVPLACLFMPFQGMRELWNASHGSSDYSGETPPLVAAWWALWLLSGFVGYGLAFLLERSGEPNLTTDGISLVLDLALAVVAIMMIRRIAEAQTQLSDPRLAEVFA